MITAISQKQLLRKQKDFSETVNYFDLNWNFVNGWQFTEGKVSGIITEMKYLELKRTPATFEEESIQTYMAPTADGGCISSTTDWYLETCTYYGSVLLNCTRLLIHNPAEDLPIQ